MKSLKDFNAEKVSLKTIWGGAPEGHSDLGSKDTDSGCCATTTDTYTDSNGNGSYDVGETITICTTVQC